MAYILPDFPRSPTGPERARPHVEQKLLGTHKRERLKRFDAKITFTGVNLLIRNSHKIAPNGIRIQIMDRQYTKEVQLLNKRSPAMAFLFN